MRARHHRLRDFGILALVTVLVASIVVAAVNAEGPRTVRADTHDGAAWLVNRSEGAIGNITRSTGEISEAVRLALPGERIDTEQAGQTVVVTNDTTGVITVVDTRTARARNELQGDQAIDVRLTGDDVTLWALEPLRVWRTTVDVLGQIDSLEELPVALESDGTGLVEISRFGTTFAVDADNAVLHRFAPGSANATTVDLDGIGDVALLGAHGDDALVVTGTGALFVVPAGNDDLDDPLPFGNVATLAQPSLPSEPVVAITDDGSIVSIDLAAGDSAAVEVSSLDGRSPLRPIVHRGCIFAVTTSPPALARSCGAVPGGRRPTPPADQQPRLGERPPQRRAVGDRRA